MRMTLTGSVGVVANGRVPCEFDTDLVRVLSIYSCLAERTASHRAKTYIGREFGPHPHQLSCVQQQLANAAAVGLESVDGGMAQLVYGLEVLCEHVRMLVVLGGDVLLDGRAKGDMVCLAKWQLQDVAVGC